MSKLPALKSKDVIKVLEKAGFSFARQRGSHRLYVKGAIGVTVPHHNKDLKKGTLPSDSTPLNPEWSFQFVRGLITWG